MHFVTTRLGKKPDVESSGQKLTWVQSPPSNAICAEFRADSMRVEYGASRAMRKSGKNTLPVSHRKQSKVSQRPHESTDFVCKAMCNSRLATSEYYSVLKIGSKSQQAGNLQLPKFIGLLVCQDSIATILDVVHR